MFLAGEEEKGRMWLLMRLRDIDTRAAVSLGDLDVRCDQDSELPGGVGVDASCRDWRPER